MARTAADLALLLRVTGCSQPCPLLIFLPPSLPPSAPHLLQPPWRCRHQQPSVPTPRGRSWPGRRIRIRSHSSQGRLPCRARPSPACGTTASRSGPTTLPARSTHPPTHPHVRRPTFAVLCHVPCFPSASCPSASCVSPSHQPQRTPPRGSAGRRRDQGCLRGRSGLSPRSRCHRRRSRCEPRHPRQCWADCLHATVMQAGSGLRVSSACQPCGCVQRPAFDPAEMLRVYITLLGATLSGPLPPGPHQTTLCTYWMVALVAVAPPCNGRRPEMLCGVGRRSGADRACGSGSGGDGAGG